MRKIGKGKSGEYGESGDSGEKVSLKIMNCFEQGVSVVSIESKEKGLGGVQRLLTCFSTQTINISSQGKPHMTINIKVISKG